MPQLGRFLHTVRSTLGLAISGASVALYREGATVNGNQSGTSPLAVTVHHAGKIATGNDVFVNTVSGTTYSATRTSDTVITLAGFAGTLALTSGDRLTPSTNPATLYSDDQGGASTTNPLTSSSTGIASCWMEYGAYEVLVSGGGATTTLFQALVTPTEMPGQVRYADAFARGSSSGGIIEALLDLPSGGGIVYLSDTTYTTTKQIVVPQRTRIVGLGKRVSTIKADTSFPISTPVVVLGATGSTRLFDIRLEHLAVNANDLAGSTCVYSTVANEGSGLFDCLIQKYRSYGFNMEASGGDLPARPELHNCEFSGSSSGATAGIRLATVESDSRLTNLTINMDGGTGTDGVILSSCSVTTENIHIEKHTDGIDLGAAASGALINIYGNSTVTNLVHIQATNSGGINCLNIVPNSGTNAILDDLTSRTLTTSSQIAYYLLGSDGAGATKSAISSSNLAAGYWQLASAKVYRAFQTFTSLDTTPSVGTGNWFKVSNGGATSITTLDDGRNGQEVTLEFTNGNTTMKDLSTGGSFALSGSADYTPAATAVLKVIYDGTTWFEVCRSNN